MVDSGIGWLQHHTVAKPFDLVLIENESAQLSSTALRNSFDLLYD